VWRYKFTEYKKRHSIFFECLFCNYLPLFLKISKSVEDSRGSPIHVKKVSTVSLRRAKGFGQFARTLRPVPLGVSNPHGIEDFEDLGVHVSQRGFGFPEDGVDAVDDLEQFRLSELEGSLVQDYPRLVHQPDEPEHPLLGLGRLCARLEGAANLGRGQLSRQGQKIRRGTILGGADHRRETKGKCFHFHFFLILLVMWIPFSFTKEQNSHRQRSVK
jgi:hypothetical protein